jgi:hypothetical protein
MEIMAIMALVILVMLGILPEIHGREHWYDQGWEDCERAHKHFEMSNNDEAVLKILKEAVKDYAKKTDAYERGDIKAIDGIEDFGELKRGVWEIFVYRKETR